MACAMVMACATVLVVRECIEVLVHGAHGGLGDIGLIYLGNLQILFDNHGVGMPKFGLLRYFECGFGSLLDDVLYSPTPLPFRPGDLPALEVGPALYR